MPDYLFYCGMAV